MYILYMNIFQFSHPLICRKHPVSYLHCMRTHRDDHSMSGQYSFRIREYNSDCTMFKYSLNHLTEGSFNVQRHLQQQMDISTQGALTQLKQNVSASALSFQRPPQKSDKLFIEEQDGRRVPVDHPKLIGRCHRCVSHI